MTADNTSSEFALLTYAHHIVDTLANRANQLIKYPSVTNSKYFRLHPLSIVRGGEYYSQALHSYSKFMYFQSSTSAGTAIVYQFVGNSVSLFAQRPWSRSNGFTLRCVAQ